MHIKCRETKSRLQTNFMLLCRKRDQKHLRSDIKYSRLALYICLIKYRVLIYDAFSYLLGDLD